VTRSPCTQDVGSPSGTSSTGISPKTGRPFPITTATRVHRDLIEQPGLQALAGHGAGAHRHVAVPGKLLCFEAVPIAADRANLGPVGLRRPTATWTYLVQDNPFGTDIDRAVRSVTRALRRLLRARQPGRTS
jgi:hypothetical protein